MGGVLKHEKIEQFLMDDLGAYKRADIYKRWQYDLQPKKEHSIREYFVNATKTEPNPIRDAQGHF